MTAVSLKYMYFIGKAAAAEDWKTKVSVVIDREETSEHKAQIILLVFLMIFWRKLQA